MLEGQTLADVTTPASNREVPPLVTILELGAGTAPEAFKALAAAAAMSDTPMAVGRCWGTSAALPFNYSASSLGAI